jgi:ABC-2 type transport system ATP-binding protein
MYSPERSATRPHGAAGIPHPSASPRPSQPRTLPIRLRVTGVRKHYGAALALAGVDLEVHEGEVVALLGANGAGKTTLLSIVAGLVAPDAGAVFIDGSDIAAQPGDAGRSLALISQETAVFPNLSVYDNLRFFGELSGLRRAGLRRSIHEIADVMRIAEALRQRARCLSGGDVRRLHIAMALMTRPGLLLLDEPTAGLDVDSRSRLLEVVGELAHSGTAICYSTHSFREVEQLRASVMMLDHGRVVARDSLERLIGLYGTSAVDLVFDGAPPALPHLGAAYVDGKRLRIATHASPATDAARILLELGTAIERVKAIELIEPNLEAVFLEITRKHSASLGGQSKGHPTA